MKPNPTKANTLLEHWKFPDNYLEPNFTDIFPLDELVWRLRTEEYLDDIQLHKLANPLRQGYYTIKPILPRSVQIFLRQNMVSVMKRRSVPAWPLDTSVERYIYDATLKLLSEIPGNELPALSLWPGNYHGAFVITHDVEELDGYKRLERLTRIELENGFRSAWYFVPGRYKVDLGMVRQLQQDGFEVGIHGLYHDGKLFRSQKIFIERAQKINQYLHEWQGVGFRSPSLIRKLEWIGEYLDIDYDTSAPTSEWFGAQPGGCRTVFPFLFDKIVELPITLQEDHTLLEILKMSPKQMLEQWAHSIQMIKEYDGLVLLIVHPDCTQRQDRLQAYNDFLQRMKSETSLWHALPKEVARWWKDRQSSHVTRGERSWAIYGKARDRGIIMKVSRNGESPHLKVEPFYKGSSSEFSAETG